MGGSTRWPWTGTVAVHCTALHYGVLQVGAGCADIRPGARLRSLPGVILWFCSVQHSTHIQDDEEERLFSLIKREPPFLPTRCSQSMVFRRKKYYPKSSKQVL